MIFSPVWPHKVFFYFFHGFRDPEAKDEEMVVQKVTAVASGAATLHANDDVPAAVEEEEEMAVLLNAQTSFEQPNGKITTI